MDVAAAWVIRLGGLGVLLCLLGIFVYMGKEAIPLFFKASAEQKQELAQTQVSNIVSIDEYENWVYRLNAAQVQLDFNPLIPETAPISIPLAQLAGKSISSAFRTPSKDKLFIGTTDGHVLIASIDFTADFTGPKRTVTPSVKEDKIIQVSTNAQPVVRVTGHVHEDGKIVLAGLFADGSMFSTILSEEAPQEVLPITPTMIGEVTGFVIDDAGEKLFVSTKSGDLYHWYLNESREKPYSVQKVGNTERHITALKAIIGGNSLILGYNTGELEQWFGVMETESGTSKPYRKIRAFDPSPAQVTVIQPSGRDRGFLAGDLEGNVTVYFTTSARTMFTTKLGEPISALSYAPKLTSFVVNSTTGRTWFYALDNKHPEVSPQVLFGKVWYEGYRKPGFEWQSSGGSDDFESKLSLVPLIFGTIKAAFYGLLFAVPIAVLAALYTSQFMAPKLRTYVKSTVEIMAALPSVVIGFIAGLWLAPVLENHMISLLLIMVLLPFSIVLAVALWFNASRSFQEKWKGFDLMVILVAVGVALYTSLSLGPILETFFFPAGVKQWIFEAFGHQFDQKNSIIIAFALGFTVIPIIFTISEDAISNVPPHFATGSLALGASRWQTAMRVILPTASPGIFSAIMVGFGRAVGETMIVLMATGNTAILSLSPFNGMRTMSANIATEIPEAAAGSTLYRILFLTAILLFIFTFFANTVAEVIRQRLREKYKVV